MLQEYAPSHFQRTLHVDRGWFLRRYCRAIQRHILKASPFILKVALRKDVLRLVVQLKACMVWREKERNILSAQSQSRHLGRCNAPADNSEPYKLSQLNDEFPVIMTSVSTEHSETPYAASIAR